MKALAFRGIAKSYGATQALHPLDLDVHPGEFLTLLGPSGSGKSTLLNIAAGHMAPDAGSVTVGGVDVTHLPPRRRNIGLVFQNFALFPHMTVYENVAYGLRARKVANDEVSRRVGEMLELMQLGGYAARRISQLSGGQQQRVALARSLIIEPDVLLLDEPMGALDRQLRKRLQLEIRRLHQRIGRTMIYVTHDQEEALVMSDRVAVFRDGRLEQIGTARELYDQPGNTFVAAFLGESNLLAGTVTSMVLGHASVRHAGLGMEFSGPAQAGLAVGQAASVLVRPETVSLSAPADGLPGEVTEIVYLGELQSVRVKLRDGSEMTVREVGNMHKDVKLGDQVGLRWETGQSRVLPQSAGAFATVSDPTR